MEFCTHAKAGRWELAVRSAFKYFCDFYSRQRLFRGEVLSLRSRLLSHTRMPKIRAFSAQIWDRVESASQAHAGGISQEVLSRTPKNAWNAAYFTLCFLSRLMRPGGD